MRYVFLLIACTIFYSCFGSKQDLAALPATNDESVSTNSPENTTAESRNTMPLPFRWQAADGTFVHVNDLSSLLAYIDDTSIRSLKLYRGTFTDLSSLVILTELEELEIGGNGYLIDISALRALTNLKSLQLLNSSRTFTASLEPLSSLVNLRRLELWHSGSYYRELLPLQQLETLKLSNGDFQEFDFSYIAQLYSLKELDIVN